MYQVYARNVQQALFRGLELLETSGVKRDSRNGPVTVLPGPVVTHYEKPLERVLLWPKRDANPFFHLYESLWMLAGRNTVKDLTPIVARMQDFSDDGVTLHSAYGHRWHHHWAFNQIDIIIAELRESPDSRRAVLQMWDPLTDLGRNLKDLPCNTNAYFQVNPLSGHLDMTVCNRSNDIIWGAYGANAVHFSILQEYVAFGVGRPVGSYYQMSNNYHAYQNVYDKLISGGWPTVSPSDDPYFREDVKPFPLISTNMGIWRRDLAMFMDEGPVMGFQDPFFKKVVVPMMGAHRQYKLGLFDKAYELIDKCRATDWHKAGRAWLKRRNK